MTDQNIDFFFEDISFEFEEHRVREWIKKVIDVHRKKWRSIQIVFCTDEYLLGINIKYLNHDYYTDIISFPYSDSPLEGELYLSIDRIRENAKELGVSFENELNRVIIHGILHLMGFEDKTPEQVAQIRNAEDEALSLF